MPRRLLALALPALLGACSPARIAGWLTPRNGAQELRGLRYGEHPRQVLDLTLPPGADAATPLVVFFHGGGWRSGERGEYVFVSRALAAEGLGVAVPDYRLWPEARWPDFVRDGAAAVAWLQRDARAPRGPLFVMGHSAGGFIAASLALDSRWLAEAGVSRDALAGAVLLAAPISWQPETEPTRSIFSAAPGGRIEAAPDAATLRGAPPALLIHGTADEVVFPLHSERLAAALRAAGVRAELRLMPGAGHIAPMTALAEPARRRGFVGSETWEALLRFLRGQGA
jgi:acetyl esterase/lipase